MNRKTAIIILRVFATVWILINIGLLIAAFSRGDAFIESLKDAFQIFLSFLLSLFLGFCMWDKRP